jgi:hypothetical protein
MNGNLKVASIFAVSNDKLPTRKSETLTFCITQFNFMFRIRMDFSNSMLAIFYVCFIKKVRSS